jgi:hypothetical protein
MRAKAKRNFCWAREKYFKDCGLRIEDCGLKRE